MPAGPEALHSFSIIARMLKDPALAPNPEFRVIVDGVQIDTIEPFLKSPQGELIQKYASMWHIDTALPGELDKKLEEISWLMVLIYGAGGWKEGHEFKADFQTQVDLLKLRTQLIVIPGCISSRPLFSCPPSWIAFSLPLNPLFYAPISR